MNNLTRATAFLFVSSLAYGTSACPNATLSTYINNGFYACTESSGQLTAEFNHDLLPSYVGLNLLSSNNSAALASSINVVAGNPGFDFDSSTFTETSGLLSAQSELVHFLLDAGSDDITQTTFSLDNAVTTNGGGLGLGTGLIIGQELLCVGGTFTSLPTGLVTSVANGVLATGIYGCNGTALIGTAADASGPLNVLTGLLNLPNITGLTDQATIQLIPTDQSIVDVIKLQALITVTGGTASDTGFGNTYTLSGTSATPEPGTMVLMLSAGVLLAGNRIFGKYLGRLNDRLKRLRP